MRSLNDRIEVVWERLLTTVPAGFRDHAKQYLAQGMHDAYDAGVRASEEQLGEIARHVNVVSREILALREANGLLAKALQETQDDLKAALRALSEMRVENGKQRDEIAMLRREVGDLSAAVRYGTGEHFVQDPG